MNAAKRKKGSRLGDEGWYRVAWAFLKVLVRLPLLEYHIYVYPGLRCMLFLLGLGFCKKIDLFTNSTAILNFIVLNVIL